MVSHSPHSLDAILPCTSTLDTKADACQEDDRTYIS